MNLLWTLSFYQSRFVLSLKNFKVKLRWEVILHTGTLWHWNSHKPGLKMLPNRFHSELCFRWEALVCWSDSLCDSRLESCPGLPWGPRVSRVEGNHFHANGLSSCTASERPEVPVLHYLFIYCEGSPTPFRKGPLLEWRRRNSLCCQEGFLKLIWYSLCWWGMQYRFVCALQHLAQRSNCRSINCDVPGCRYLRFGGELASEGLHLYR